jgi:hypothetical protein
MFLDLSHIREEEILRLARVHCRTTRPGESKCFLEIDLTVSGVIQLLWCWKVKLARFQAAPAELVQRLELVTREAAQVIHIASTNSNADGSIVLLCR